MVGGETVDAGTKGEQRLVEWYGVFNELDSIMLKHFVKIKTALWILAPVRKTAENLL